MAGALAYGVLTRLASGCSEQFNEWHWYMGRGWWRDRGRQGLCKWCQIKFMFKQQSLWNTPNTLCNRTVYWEYSRKLFVTYFLSLYEYCFMHLRDQKCQPQNNIRTTDVISSDCLFSFMCVFVCAHACISVCMLTLKELYQQGYRQTLLRHLGWLLIF